MHTVETDARHHRRDGRGRQGARLQIHAITDHSKEPGIRQRPRRPPRPRTHSKNSTRQTPESTAITIFAGIEVDIPRLMATSIFPTRTGAVDFVICQVHFPFSIRNRRKMTGAACLRPFRIHTSIVGHPTAACNFGGTHTQFDMDAILRPRLNTKFAMGLNST